MCKRVVATVALCLVLLLPMRGGSYTIPWPIELTGQTHPLGNVFGEFQNGIVSFYSPYFHTGIDIRAEPWPDGPWVVSCMEGVPVYIRSSETKGDEVVIHTTGAVEVEHSYGHLEPGSIPLEVTTAHEHGGTLPAGTRLGKLFNWLECGFDHLHFKWSPKQGSYYVPANPLLFLEPATDNDDPVVHDICIFKNNTNDSIPKPASGTWYVAGDIDIIALVDDKVRPNADFSGTDQVGVYKISYEIEELSGGGHDIPETVLWEFTELPSADQARVMFKLIGFGNVHSSNSNLCGSRKYWYIVTNTNGGILTEEDGFWDTDAVVGGERLFPEGEYEITVRAWDAAGNVGYKSETVYVVHETHLFLIDRSGSMTKFVEGSDTRTRFAVAQEWAEADAIAAFTDTEASGMVLSFTTDASGNIDLRPELGDWNFSTSLEDILYAIDNIEEPGYLTPLARALSDAADILYDETYVPWARSLYVYTDGHENASEHNNLSDVCGDCVSKLDDPPNIKIPEEWDPDCAPCTGYQRCLINALAANQTNNVRYFGEVIRGGSAKVRPGNEPIPEDADPNTVALEAAGGDGSRTVSPPPDFQFLYELALQSGGSFTFVRDYPFPVVKLEKTHNSLQGHYAYISITIENSDLAMGGFDLLIAYDASALTFIEATPGQLLEDCGWEYFTYRFGMQGNCGDACPSGLLRIVAIADINNGSNHPGCFGPPEFGYDPFEMAEMKFYVTDDRTYQCQYVPIYFFWDDCGDNAISNVSGDTLYLDRAIYDFEGNLIWDEQDDDEYPEEVRTPSVGAPDYCLNGYKVRPIRYIDFWNGGVDIACAESIDVRGDLNLNSVAHEIADAVLYANYFLYGISVFDIAMEGQIAASDVNNDGIRLSVGDLVYLIRIITGDVLPYPKLAPYAQEAEAGLTVDRTALVVSTNSPTDIGAGYFHVEFAGCEFDEPYLMDGAAGMTLKYHEEDDALKVLVYSMEKGRRIASGTGNIFAVPLRGEGAITLDEVQLSDYNGNMLSVTTQKEPALPTAFALQQNYPNPFNAITEIRFSLPQAVHVKLEVFNALGQKVAVLVDRKLEAGYHSATWDGSTASSGVYFYRIKAGDFVESRKMILLK
jgi:hypothetical protein